MKKNIYLLLTLAAVFSCIACCSKNSFNPPVNQNGKINVTATIFPPFDFVRNIAKDRVNLAMLLPPGSESHSFEPSPRDIITIRNSGIFIYGGGESDKWIDVILKSMDTGSIKILSMMEAVDVVEEEITEGMEDNDNEDDTPYDEHVWTSPQNAILIVRAITDLLCEADPDNAGFFRQNAALYIESLEGLDTAFKTIVSGAKRSTIVFADRFPFRYFTEAYGLSYFAAFPGCSAETEPSAATIAFLINKVRAEQIPVVFHIEFSNERMADTICGETGASKLLFHSCHNVSRKDIEASPGYLELMANNAENLRKALY